MCPDMSMKSLEYGHKMSAGISLLGNHDFVGRLLSVAQLHGAY